MSAPSAAHSLVFQRTVDLSPAELWWGWTQPEALMHWFTPAPWRTIEAEVDLRAGGVFRTVMQPPEGDPVPNLNCVLEVVPERRFVWTSALRPGFQPAPLPTALGFAVTAIITLDPVEGGTRYTGTVLHADEAGRDAHDRMGFQDGWGAALDQLVALVKGRRG